MLPEPIASFVNHLLRGADWARARLLPFVGRAVQVDAAPFRYRFAIAPEGLIAAAPPDAQPEATIRLALPIMFRIAVLRDPSARREVHVEGDNELAAALAAVMAELKWDVEEDLSRVIGDVAAHRVVQTGSAFATWQSKTFSNLSAAAGEYLTEESAVLAPREAVKAFVSAVDTLREDVDRLDKRIEALARRKTSGDGV